MSQVAALRRPVEERFGNSSGHVGGGSRKKWVKERECGGAEGWKAPQCTVFEGTGLDKLL